MGKVDEILEGVVDETIAVFMEWIGCAGLCCASSWKRH